MPYTFVEVGWWLHQLFPYPHSIPGSIVVPKHYAGDPHQKTLVSTMDSIGVFMARIIADPPTLNNTVVIHDGEACVAETWEIAEKVTGEDFSDYQRVRSIDVHPSIIVLTTC